MSPWGHGVCVLVGTSGEKEVKITVTDWGTCDAGKKNGSMANVRDQAARAVTGQEREKKILS